MIYVLCPADVKTGGTELLHQLVKTLTDVKVPAGIVYTDIRRTSWHESRFSGIYGRLSA